MGVLGLTPFLQKTCPEVIKLLPERLKGLSGKRIVFDGTLITQRFHFAQVPHQYRHVLGWYRMIKELQAYGVEAVCVFDGKQRTAAKAAETLRRKEAQRLSIAREAIENERLQRLNQLRGVVSHVARLTPTEKASLSDALALRNVPVKDAEDATQLPPPPRQDITYSDPLNFWLTVDVGYPSDESRYIDGCDSGSQNVQSHAPSAYDLEDVLQEEPTLVVHCASEEEVEMAPISSSHFPPEDHPSEIIPTAPQEASLWEGLPPQKEEKLVDPVQTPPQSRKSSSRVRPPLTDSELFSILSESHSRSSEDVVQSATIPSSEEDVQDNDAQPDIEQITRALYYEYRSSVPQITSIPLPSKAEAGAVESAPDADAAKVEYEMSKRQYQLTLEEGKFWEALTSALSTPVTVESDKVPLMSEELQQQVEEGTQPMPGVEPQQEVEEFVLIDLSKEPQVEEESVPPTSDEDFQQVEEEEVVTPISQEEPPQQVDEEVVEPISHEEMLSSLVEKSTLISESYARRTLPLTTQTYDEAKEILRAMGIPVVEPAGPFEAEALASALVLNGYADYVASEDTDVLIYEAPLLRNITSRDRPLVMMSGADVRSMLQLTRSMFIDFALLMGTDFSQRIKNVGPARALKFIREYGSIEKVIEAETKYPLRMPPEDYLKQVDAGRSVFSNLPPVPPEDGLKQGKVDEEQIWHIMEKYRLSRELEWDWGAALEGNYFDDNPRL